MKSMGIQRILLGNQFFQLLKPANFCRSILLLVLVFVSLAWSVESIASLKCTDVLRNHAVARHFVEVLDGEFKLGFDWKPRKNLKNKVIFLDGLSLTFPHSERFARAARAKGLPLVRLDMLGTGNSLRRQWDEAGQFGRGNELPAELQALAVADFISQISSQPVHLVGLSYGGGIAALVAKLRPDLVKNLILINPFVVDIGDLRSAGLNAFTRWNPFLRTMVDNQRNEVLSNNFSKFLPDYMAHIPQVYFDSLHQLTEGIRSYDLRRILPSVEVPTHLLTGEADQFINNRFYDESFNEVPVEYRGNYTELTAGPHDIVNAEPDFLARWLSENFFE